MEILCILEGHRFSLWWIFMDFPYLRFGHFPDLNGAPEVKRRVLPLHGRPSATLFTGGLFIRGLQAICTLQPSASFAWWPFGQAVRCRTPRPPPSKLPNSEVNCNRTSGIWWEGERMF